MIENVLHTNETLTPEDDNSALLWPPPVADGIPDGPNGEPVKAVPFKVLRPLARTAGSRQTIQAACQMTAAHKPHIYYCTGGTRFGPYCMDCSGFCYMMYRAAGYTIPADSMAVANWGRANGQVRPVSQAIVSDLLVYDKYGDPYHSTGSRGHIGIFVGFTDPSKRYIITYESRGGYGVGINTRPANFWLISVRHPALATDVGTPPPLPKAKKSEMFRIIKGDQSATLWLTNWLEKRKIGSPAEAVAIVTAGITDGQPGVTWPELWVDSIPVAS